MDWSEEKLSWGGEVGGGGGGGLCVCVWGGTHVSPFWEVLPHFLPVESGQCQQAPAGPGLPEWANAMWRVTRGI